MNNTLKSLYFDGYELHKAINFCLSVYGRTPSKKTVSAVRKSIKDCTGIDWTISGTDLGAEMMRSIYE